MFSSIMKSASLKYIVILPLILGTLIILNSFTMPPPEDEIIGTWKCNSDELWKITFTESGIRRDYYKGILQNIYQYYITDTCLLQTLQEGQLFLKTVDSDNEVTCDILESVNNNSSGILSITSERGDHLLYTKE